MTGIEPANAGITTQCLNHLATLAYYIKNILQKISYCLVFLSINLVGITGFEPVASCSQGRRATKLRYIPITETTIT